MSKLTKLHVEKLGAVRGGRPVYRQLEFSVSLGEILALRGPNGCGKTTILRTLAGLLEPAYGHIFRNGALCRSFPPLKPYDFAWIAHGNGIKKELTAVENLSFLAALMPSGDKQKITKALEKMQLSEVAHKQARFYSAGQMRRLALCRLLVCPAPLWIMDEPLNALDQEGRKLLKNMILSHVEKQGMVIMADHENFLSETAHNFDIRPFVISAKNKEES